MTSFAFFAIIVSEESFLTFALYNIIKENIIKLKNAVLSFALTSCLFSGSVLPTTIMANESDPSSEITPHGSTRVENTLISVSYPNNVFVGYSSMISTWQKASSYTVSASYTQTATGTYNYDGVSIGLSVSNTAGASYVLQADSTRYSRLGIWADLTVRKYKATQIDNNSGQVLSTWYFGTAQQRNTYVNVVYQ